MEPTEGAFVFKTPRFVVVGGADGVWASVQGIRLRDGDAPDAVAEVRELLAAGRDARRQLVADRARDPRGRRRAAARRGTPARRRRLPARRAPRHLASRRPGRRRSRCVLRPPPEEWATVRELQDSVFDNPPERRPTRDQLLAEFGRTETVLFGGWLDGGARRCRRGEPEQPRDAPLGRVGTRGCAWSRLLPRPRARSLGRGRPAWHACLDGERERQVRSRRSAGSASRRCSSSVGSRTYSRCREGDLPALQRRDGVATRDISMPEVPPQDRLLRRRDG